MDEILHLLLSLLMKRKRKKAIQLIVAIYTDIRTVSASSQFFLMGQIWQWQNKSQVKVAVLAKLMYKINEIEFSIYVVKK